MRSFFISFGAIGETCLVSALGQKPRWDDHIVVNDRVSRLLTEVEPAHGLTTCNLMETVEDCYHAR